MVGPKVLLQGLFYSAHNLIVVANDSCQKHDYPAAARNTLLGVISRRSTLEAAAERAFANARPADLCPPTATAMRCLDLVADSLGHLPGKRVQRAVAVVAAAGDATAEFYEAARVAAEHLLSPEVRQAATALAANACVEAAAAARGAAAAAEQRRPIVHGRGLGEVPFKQQARAGMSMPAVGFGMGCPQLSEDRYEGVGEDDVATRGRIDARVRGLVEHAIAVGYRLFGTAELYQNEHVLENARTGLPWLLGGELGSQTRGCGPGMGWVGSGHDATPAGGCST